VDRPDQRIYEYKRFAQVDFERLRSALGTTWNVDPSRIEMESHWKTEDGVRMREPLSDTSLQFGDDGRSADYSASGGRYFSLSLSPSKARVLATLIAPSKTLAIATFRAIQETLGLESQDASDSAEIGPQSIDPALWEHVGNLVETGNWVQVASQTAIFVEDRIRTWAGRPVGEVGERLMTEAFGVKSGKLVLGRTEGEHEGWHRIAMGLSMALRNVDTHHIQNRPDVRQYAIGVLGAGSLLLTQTRYQYPGNCT
jgi:hypothetical protein